MPTTDQVLVLDEHASASAVSLTVDQAEALRCSPARLEVRHSGRAGRYDLRTSSMVGVVVAAGVRVTIRPKIPIARLFYLLGYSARLPILGAIAPFDEDADLLECLAPHYAKVLGQALSRGLVREYAEHTDTLHAVRGRIDLLDLVTRRFGVWPPVPCEFSDHTADTLPNQLMLAASVLLRRLTTNADVDAALVGLEARMDEVARVRFPSARVPAARLDRRHAHCAAAVRMAEVVLRHMSMELGSGSMRSASFLVDMNALYEDFVVTAVGAALRGGGRWTRHPRGIYLDETREIRLVPDALLEDRNRHPVAVVDAKYKVVGGPVNEDIYQMVAYCTRLRIRHAVLVYATTPPGEHRLPDGVFIHRVELNPDGDPGTLESRADSVASLVESLVSKR